MDPFVAEIRIFAGNFPPTGWAFCNGQLLPIMQNTALFSLLGTFYGGDGESTFALPDLRGRAPIHQGQGQGLSQRIIGETGGSEFVTLIESEIPVHTHAALGRSSLGNQQSPVNNTWSGSQLRPFNAAPNTQMNVNAVQSAGGNLPHNNMPPYLAVNFIIALVGVFPPRD
jgi:microcystin-dependent protein